MGEFNVKQLWNDEEVNGRIYLQYCLLSEGISLEDSKKQEILKVLMNCMTKLSAVKYHFNNYSHKEKEKQLKITGMIKKNRIPDVIHEEYDLIFEIETFLFQVKSSLDLLVKILCPILDRKPGQISSFGDYGQKIINTLENISYKKYDKERVNMLINLLNEDKTWIKYITDLRDKVSHYEALKDINFTIGTLPNSNPYVIRPKLKGTHILEILETISYNLLTFHQDFLGLALQLTFKKIIVLRFINDLDMEELNKTYGKYSKYLKWSLGMNSRYLEEPHIR